MSDSLLPTGSSTLERAAAQALSAALALDVPMRDLWSPERCPLDLLPFLAWAFSVDRWDSGWSESTKRCVVRASYFIHKHKGTIAALRRVVEPLGYLLEVIEWWETAPAGVPGTFRLRVGVQEHGIDADTIDELERLIDDAKPLTRHLVGLSIEIESRGPAYTASALVVGDDMTIYPFSLAEREVQGLLYAAALMHGGEITTIYPFSRTPQ